MDLKLFLFDFFKKRGNESMTFLITYREVRKPIFGPSVISGRTIR